MNKFLVGEWVERRTDGVAGIVRDMEWYNNAPLYRVELNRFPRAENPEDDFVLGTETAWRHRHHVHAHVEHESRDCDGKYSGAYCITLEAEERTHAHGDMKFRERVIKSLIGVYSYGTLRITPEGAEWLEDTDEGYRASSVRWCEDNCDDVPSWLRDHSAEEAGY